MELVCGGEVIDRCHKQLGLRTLTVSTELDADGKGSEFCFVLNGVKIFSMGANLVPMDSLLSRVTGRRWEAVVRQAVDANFKYPAGLGRRVLPRQPLLRAVRSIRPAGVAGLHTA